GGAAFGGPRAGREEPHAPAVGRPRRAVRLDATGVADVAAGLEVDQTRAERGTDVDEEVVLGDDVPGRLDEHHARDVVRAGGEDRAAVERHVGSLDGEGRALDPRDGEHLRDDEVASAEIDRETAQGHRDGAVLRDGARAGARCAELSASALRERGGRSYERPDNDG